MSLQHQAEVQALAAEAMGWQPVAEGIYLHQGKKSDPQPDQVVHIVGLPDLALAGENIFLLT